MGALDSSFLFLPFGNDLLVVTLVARNHHGLPWYVIAAALGSTLGVFLLAFVAGKLGEEGIKKMAGLKRFDRLSRMIKKHGAVAVVLACIAPPPFPFTMVIASAAALKYSRLRIAVIKLCPRCTLPRSGPARYQVWEGYSEDGRLYGFSVDHDRIYRAMSRRQRVLHLWLG